MGERSYSKEAERLYRIISSKKYALILPKVLVNLNYDLSEIQPQDPNGEEDEMTKLRKEHYTKRRCFKLQQVIRNLSKSQSKEKRSQEELKTLPKISEISKERVDESFKRRKETAMRALSIQLEDQKRLLDKCKSKERTVKKHSIQPRSTPHHPLKPEKYVPKVRVRQEISSTSRHSRSFSPSRSIAIRRDDEAEIVKQMNYIQTRIDKANERSNKFLSERAASMHKRSASVLKARRIITSNIEQSEVDAFNAAQKISSSIARGQKLKAKSMLKQQQKLIEAHQARFKRHLDIKKLQRHEQRSSEKKLINKEMMNSSKIKNSKLKQIRDVQMKKEKDLLYAQDVGNNREKIKNAHFEKKMEMLHKHYDSRRKIEERKRALSDINQYARIKDIELNREREKAKDTALNTIKNAYTTNFIAKT